MASDAAPKSSRWPQMARDAPTAQTKWHQMAPDGPTAPKSPDGLGWHQMAPDCQRWFQMAADASRMRGRQYVPLKIGFLFFVQWEVSDSQNVVSVRLPGPDISRWRQMILYVPR